MTIIENTVILSIADLRPEFKIDDTIDVYSFRITQEQINKASNILFVQPDNNVVFFKIRRSKQFIEKNPLIMLRN